MASQSFPQLEKNILAYWKQYKIFERSMNERPADKQFVFYDGPPFATGLPHYGHIVASTLKDVVPRFWTMQGCRVERRWGWDCHGLPIENLIEQELGLKTKQDIEAIGVAKFNAACQASVLKYAKDWRATVERLGRWVDMTNAYRTMDSTYTESIWWAFKQLYDKGLIYQGKKAMHVCPRCVTPLSNFEVTLGYKAVDDLAMTWKFPITDQPNTCLLAWTTTPWSTPGTVGLSVGPDFTYCKVKVGTEFVYVVKERLAAVLEGKGDYQVVAEVKGQALIGLQYEPIVSAYDQLPEVAENTQVYHVFPADYVEVTEGTGIVTINGAYGEIDMAAAQRNQLPIIMDVTMDGKYNEKAGVYSGMTVQAGQEQLVQDVLAQGRVWKTDSYRHSYPHCWRCDTPLLNYATTSWFVKVTAIKQRMIAHNQTVQWIPQHLRDGRFGKWLEGAKDWAISRERYWGAPLPVWQAEDGAVICVGSVAELTALSGVTPTDLHKQYVDDIVIERDGKTYRRVPAVLDCWFESGSMPFAQEHYPFEHKEKFDHHFPAQFIAEGLDQTRGWFYTLLVLSTALFDKPAFQNVLVNGLVLAADGKKMSKRLKNYPEPTVILDKYGADALRFYLMSSPVVRAEDLRFSEAGVDLVMKKVLLTLWNVATFYRLFAQGQTIADQPQPWHIMDRWMLAYLQTANQTITQAMLSYDLHLATHALEELVQTISTWYVRRSRQRFKTDGADKVAALATLRHVLLTTVKLLAPFTPFMAEQIYLDITGGAASGDSVHVQTWPKVRTEFIDEPILQQMAELRAMVEQILAKREAAGIKVRQPLASVTVPTSHAWSVDAQQVLLEEVNVIKFQVGPELQLDTTITPALAEAGLIRELVRSINALRKQQGLTIHDRVTVIYDTTDASLRRVIKNSYTLLANSTLANSFEPGQGQHELIVNGAKVKVALQK